MNAILKKILLAAEEASLSAVSATLPGSGALIAGVRKLLDKDHTNNSEAITDVGDGLITAVNSLKGDEVINETLVAQGVLEVRSGLSKIRAGIK